MHCKFDWDKCPRNKKSIEYLLSRFQENIDIDIFVSEMRKLKKYGTRTRNYTPSNLKKDYRRLKKRFGFFTGYKHSQVSNEKGKTICSPPSLLSI